uniref:Integrase catalytic domain-containing protein n=1 Tax=Globodera pallida TaxID=36090 RepID=A0A183C7W7_GLOPA
MTTKSSAATIERLRYLFTRHGIPETLVSDNGTQFTSNEFAKFTAANGINHLFSAPYNPMSNGQVERFKDTFKRAFRKIKGEGVASKEIIDTFLVTYRTTPNDSLPKSVSPAEMLLGRNPSTTLDLLKPPPSQPVERDVQMEKDFNRRFGTKLRTFVLRDKVFARYRLSQVWRAGTIYGGNGVIYDVRFSDESTGRFHANQLRLRRGPTTDRDPLNILNETFNLPIQGANLENRLEQPEQQEVGENGAVENLPAAEADHSPPARTPPYRRYPERQRRVPARFSPG